MILTDVVIVGAGVSGLSFAYRCAKNRIPHVLLEAEGRLGGSIHTFTDSATGAYVELGAHTLSSSYLATLDLIEDLGLAVVQSPRMNVMVSSKGRTRSIALSIHWAQLLAHLPRALLSRPIYPSGTIKSYCEQWLGAGNYQEVVRPLLAALLNQDPDHIPANYLATKLGRMKRRRDVPRNFTTAGGLQKWVDALGQRSNVWLNTAVASIATPYFSD